MLMVFVLQFLIGYNRGLIVLWDNEASNADQTYNSTQVSVDLQPTKNPSLSNIFVKEYKPICYELNPEILPKDTQVNNSPQCVRICNEKKKMKALNFVIYMMHMFLTATGVLILAQEWY